MFSFISLLLRRKNDDKLTDDCEEYYIKRGPVTEEQRVEEEEAILFMNKKNEMYQTTFIKIALVNKSLREATDKVGILIERMVQRGEDLDPLIEQSERLDNCSKLFYRATLPWYMRWWVSLCDSIKNNCCYCCYHNKRKKRITYGKA